MVKEVKRASHVDVKTTGDPIDAPESQGKELGQALEELSDPMVPVRGHGLISLARMLEDGHQDVKGKGQMLLKVP